MKSLFISAAIAVGVLASVPAQAASAESALATKYGCLACHSWDNKLVGPAYKDVVKKYGKLTPALEDTLAKRVVGGSTANGGENWKAITGGVPMPANAAMAAMKPADATADAKKLVKWIFAGAK